MQGMEKSGKLPATKMSSKKQHTFAPGEGAFIVLKSIINHHLAYIFYGVLGKLADFRQLAAEGGELSTQNSGPLACGFFPAMPWPDFACPTRRRRE